MINNIVQAQSTSILQWLYLFILKQIVNKIVMDFIHL